MDAKNQPPWQRDQFYPRDRRSVPAARRFVAWSLRYWGLVEWERSDDVLLCVSELATNAVVHGAPPGRGFLVRVRYDGDVLRVEAHDSGPGVPRVEDEADEGGRGLLLVSALSDKWGVGERRPGKAVWCEFACTGDQLLEKGWAGRGAFASKEKTLHAGAGKQMELPRFEADGAVRFFSRHLN